MPDIFVANKTSAAEPSAPKKPRQHTTHHEVSSMLKKHRPNLNPFAAFAIKPPVHLQVQEDQEEVLLLLRRHLITTIPWVFTALAMIVGPLLLNFVPILTFLPSIHQFLALVLWYLLVIAFVIEKFLSWYFNVYIVTDERIIDVDFLNLLYRNISSAKIEHIQDVTVKVTGAIQGIFNFGNVSIQTAGEVPEIQFELVPKPQEVAKFLNEMILAEEQEKIEGRVR
jgi:uncharacterized membrane protein YdbT with pleckstrin-like domain